MVERAVLLNELVDLGDEAAGSGLSGASTPMHQACRNGDVWIVRSLMAAGARWDIPDTTGATAKGEAQQLKTSQPDTFRKIMELLAEPMPTCPDGCRCVRMQVCASMSCV